MLVYAKLYSFEWVFSAFLVHCLVMHCIILNWKTVLFQNPGNIIKDLENNWSIRIKTLILSIACKAESASESDSNNDTDSDTGGRDLLHKC